jgi:hypothetical protein
MKEREPVTKKHIHAWKLTLRRDADFERRCECGAVQHAEIRYALRASLPPSLLQYADVAWQDGPIPPPQPSYSYGPYGVYP